jgi:hypothetical protein
VLVEAHDEWQVSDRRYLSEASMALLTETSKEVAPPSSCRHRLPTLTPHGDSSYTTPRDVTRVVAAADKRS